MRKEFVEHITYSRFRDCYSPTATEKSIIDFCNSHNVDVEYTKDRVNFFTAITATKALETECLFLYNDFINNQTDESHI